MVAEFDLNINANIDGYVVEIVVILVNTYRNMSPNTANSGLRVF